jgi:hypothetical protein
MNLDGLTEELANKKDELELISTQMVVDSYDFYTEKNVAQTPALYVGLEHGLCLPQSKCSARHAAGPAGPAGRAGGCARKIPNTIE